MTLKTLTSEKRVIPFLFGFIALHSFFVGFILIFHPFDIIDAFSCKAANEHFFAVQGGVFHILMAMLYALIALQMYHSRCLVYFSLFVKCSAAIFLFSYYLFVKRILLVLICGMGDFAMAILIFLVILRRVNGDTRSQSLEKKPFDRDELLDRITRLIDFF
jgi:hypothetical protein